MPWATGRRQQLPPDWGRRRVAVQARAGGQCEAVEQGKRCLLPGTDCDHVDGRLDHSLANLQWLCAEHHRQKTSSEAAEARSQMYARGRHPVERPPGLR